MNANWAGGIDSVHGASAFLARRFVRGVAFLVPPRVVLVFFVATCTPRVVELEPFGVSLLGGTPARVKAVDG